ncbi:Uncharacterised protein [uncultured archaeon]|nr:Uncharacterised protein [uncultured archaeon]
MIDRLGAGISLKIEEKLRMRIKMKKLKEKKLEGYPKVERKEHGSVCQAKGLQKIEEGRETVVVPPQ